MAIIEPLFWFSFDDELKQMGFIGYISLILVPFILTTIILLFIPILKNAVKPAPSLAPDKPKEKISNKVFWYKIRVKSEFTFLLKENQSTMLLTWPNVNIEKFDLIYDKNNSMFKRYDKNIHPIVQDVLDKWKVNNKTRYNDLEAEDWGIQVRLEKYDYDHKNHKHRIYLSPIKFLYYQAIQSRLWDKNLSLLRNLSFRNAFNALKEQRSAILPNNFALHMAIVSSDEKIMIRKRPDETTLYPGVWEASIGEFMHGPKHLDFPHFDENGKPNLGLFCKNAVFEETNYKDADPAHFEVYGFGIEYLTLAPKLFVVYRSDQPMVTLLNQGKPKDQGLELASIELNPRSLAGAFSCNSKYLWSPSSKIISLYALLGNLTKIVDKEIMLTEFKKLYKP